MWTLILLLSSLFPAGTGAVATVTGYTGHSVEIRCHYDSGHETSMKYLCRGTCSTLKAKDIPVDSKSAKDKRFSLHDNTTARHFTVTITDLRSEDQGTYWCSVQQTLRDYYSEIQLVVIMDPVNTSISHLLTFSPPTTSLSTSVRTEYKQPVPGHPLNDDNQSSTSSTSPSHEPLTYASVGLVVVITALLVTTTALCKQKRKTMTSVPTESIPVDLMPVTTTKDECIYDEIKDEDLKAAVRFTPNTVYTTAKGPSRAVVYSTIDESSDSVIYSDVTMTQKTQAHPLSSTAARDSVVYSTVVF